MPEPTDQQSPYQPPDTRDLPQLQPANKRQLILIRLIAAVGGVLVTSVVIAAGGFVSSYLDWHIAFLFLSMVGGPAFGIFFAIVMRRLASSFLGVRAPELREERESLKMRLENELEEFRRTQGENYSQQN